MGLTERGPPAGKPENVALSVSRNAGFINSMKWTNGPVPIVHKPEDGGNMNHIDRRLKLLRRVNYRERVVFAPLKHSRAVAIWQIESANNGMFSPHGTARLSVS